MAVIVVDGLEVVGVEQNERERPAVSAATRDRHLQQPIEAAPVVETGEGIGPGVVSKSVEAQGEHTERKHERTVEAVIVERRPRVEAGRRDEELLVFRAERASTRAEYLRTQTRFLDHHGGVVELELLDERVEGLVDERDA